MRNLLNISAAYPVALMIGLALLASGCDPSEDPPRSTSEETSATESADRSANTSESSSHPSSNAPVTYTTNRPVPTAVQPADPMIGRWRRTTSPWKGMQVNVFKTASGYAGFVASTTRETYYGTAFEVGDLKWRSVKKESESFYMLYDLSIGGEVPYQVAHIVLSGKTLTLRPANGNKDQVWERVW